MSKSRLTITLDEKLLAKIDESLNGANLRNRSQAIEHFLRESLISQPTKVLILSGGKPVRFPELKEDIPKSLLPINGTPLLSYTLASLKDAGFSEIYLSIGRLGDKIKDHFSRQKSLGLRIHYLKQSSAVTGTAEALFEAKKYFSANTFLMIYGDVLTELNFRDLVEFHQARDCLATMALTSVEKTSEWGVASVQGSRVVDFVEKPRVKTKSHLINAGVYVFNPEVFKYLSKASKRLEQDLFPRLSKERQVCAYPFEGFWQDVANSAIYKKVLRDWKG